MATEAEILQRVKEGARQPIKDIPSLRRFIDRNSKALNAVPPTIGAFHEQVELRPGLTADISVPTGPGPFPLMLYLHGGGWVAGNAASHRKLGMQFAEQGCLTVNLDYRLAPEAPFPAGLDDCRFAAEWAVANAQRWNGDGSRIAIGGDSAGGNLAAATQIALANAGSSIKFKAGLLIYGLYDVHAVIEREKGSAAGLTMMAQAYLANQYPTLLNDARVSPLRGVKAGILPPQYILCGSADFLLPESDAMAAACKAAGIPCELDIVPEMPHGFIQIWMLSAANAAALRMFAFLRRYL